MKKLCGIIFSCLLIICLGGALLFNAVQPVSTLSNSETLNKVSANAGSTLVSDDYDGYWVDDPALEGVVYADLNDYFNNKGKFATYGNAGGEGTKGTPYLINDALDLAFISKIVRVRSGSNTLVNKYFKLNNNIDLAGKYFTPIGGEYLRFENADGSYSYGWRNFSGNIDGNNKTISNMYINNLNVCENDVDKAPNGTLAAGQQLGREYRTASLGFIGYGSRCSVSNLNFENCTVTLDVAGNYVGSAIGYLTEGVATNISAKNCTVTESYTAAENKTNYFGGVIGYMINSVAEYVTAVNTKVEGDYHVGSAIGGVNSATANHIRINKIDNEIVSSSSSDVSGCYVVGGAIGLVTASASVDGVDVNNVNVIYRSTTNRDAYMGGAFGSVQTNSLAQNIVVNNTKINDTLNTQEGQTVTCGRIGGLTGNINEGIVKNVVIKENCVIIGTDEIGGAAGVVERGELTNLVNYAPIGKRSNGTIVNVDAVGGIAAYLYSSSTTKVTFVTNCHNYGTINGKSKVGGIIGTTNSISDSGQRIEVYNCSNTAEINATGSYVGGLLGYGYAGLYMHDCYNSGQINVNDASEAIGGIVGYMYIYAYNPDSKIEDCYNSGNIINAGTNSAGIIGKIYVNYFNAIYYDARVHLTLNRLYNSGTLSGYNGKNYDGSSAYGRVYYSNILNFQIVRHSNNNEYYNKILLDIQNIYATSSPLFDISDTAQPNKASTTNYNNYNNAVENTKLWANIKNYAGVNDQNEIVSINNNKDMEAVLNDYSYFAGDMETVSGKTTVKGTSSWIMDSEAFEGKRPYLRNIDARYLSILDKNENLKYVYTVYNKNSVTITKTEYDNELVPSLKVLGYSFKGLTDTPKADEADNEYILETENVYTTTMTNNIILYAIYTEDAIKVYKVNFEGFDDEDADKLETIIGESSIYDNNKSILVYVVEDGNNYRIVGVNINGTKTGKTETNASFNTNDYLDITLSGLFENARWSMQNVNGGYSSIESITNAPQSGSTEENYYNRDDSEDSDFNYFNLSSKTDVGLINYIMKNSSMFILASDDETTNMGVITLKCDHSTIASIYISYKNDGKIFVGSVEDSLEENYNYFTFETNLSNGGSRTLFVNVILNKYYEEAVVELKPMNKVNDPNYSGVKYTIKANESGFCVFELLTNGNEGVYSYVLSVDFVKKEYKFGFDPIDTIGNDIQYDLSGEVLINGKSSSEFVIGDVIKVETILAETGDVESFVFDNFRLFNQINNAYSSADVVYTTEGEKAYFEFTVTESFLTTYLDVADGELVVKAVYVPQYKLIVLVEKEENPNIDADIKVYVGSDANNLTMVDLADFASGIWYDVNTRVKIFVTPNDKTSLVGYTDIAPGEMFEGYVQFDIVKARKVVIELDSTSYALSFGAITQNGATISYDKDEMGEILVFKDNVGDDLFRLAAGEKNSQISEILVNNSFVESYSTEYKFIGYAIKGYFYVNNRNQAVEVVYRKQIDVDDNGEPVYDYRHYNQTDLFVKRHQEAISAFLTAGYEFYGYYDVNSGEYYTYDESLDKYISELLDDKGEAKTLTYRKVVVSLPTYLNDDGSTYDIAGWLKNINTENDEFIKTFVSDEATDKIYIYAQFMQQYEVSISVSEQCQESGTFKVYVDGVLYKDASGKSSFLNLDIIVPTGSSLKIVADSTVGYQFDKFVNCRTISDEKNSTTLTIVRDYPMINLNYVPELQITTIVPELSNKADFSVTSSSGVINDEVSYAIGDVLVFRLSSKPLYEVSDVVLNGMTAEEITQKYNATFDGNTLTVVVDQNWVKDMVSSNFDLKVNTKLQATVLYIIIALSVVAVAVTAFIIMSIISNNKLKAKVTAEMQQEFRQEMRFNASGVIAGLRAGNDDVGRLTDAEIKAEMKRRKKEGK